MPKARQPNVQKAELPSAFSLLMPSWKAIALNLVTFIEIVIIPFIIELIGVILNKHGNGADIKLVFSIAGDLVSLLLAPALIVTQLQSIRGERIDFTLAVRQGLKFFWRYVGLAICMALVIIGGFVLLIVPGFFMIRRYILAPFYLVDQDLKILEAMRVSAEQSKRFSWAVWGLLGVELLFVVLSFIFIGIVLSIMYYCAAALRYDQIRAASKAAPKKRLD